MLVKVETKGFHHFEDEAFRVEGDDPFKVSLSGTIVGSLSEDQVMLATDINSRVSVLVQLPGDCTLHLEVPIHLCSPLKEKDFNLWKSEFVKEAE